MKLSENTIRILKHFSGMNESILFTRGEKIFTQASSGAIAAEVTISENFPFEFGVYKLKNFLSLIDLVGPEAELTFSEEENCVTIEQGSNSLRYHFSAPSVIKVYKKPDSMANLPDFDIEFTLTQEAWSNLKAAANTLEAAHIVFKSDNGKIRAHVETVGKEKDASQNTFSVEVGVLKEDVEFSFVFKHEMMNLYRGSYRVRISEQGLSQFDLLDDEVSLTFWVGLTAQGTTFKRT